MLKEIHLNSVKIQYDMQYKNVKNINLRIKSDGSINVSANKYVPQKVIENFLISRADFILKALNRCENKEKQPCVQYFSESEIRSVILSLCRKVYPYFESRGVRYPEIKFRKMVSQWGNCRSSKGVLTFNTNLVYAPLECVEYVVLHEFTHFLQPNHSKLFYEELQKICPNWQECRSKLKKIHIR